MAVFTFAPYQAATYCSRIAQPGNIYLAAFIEEMFPETRLLNIESCRNIVGGVDLSHHAEGRANDEGVPQARPADGVSIGFRICELLLPYGRELGIDHAICNLAPWQSGRGQPRSYSAASPQGKVYTGLHPHKDHNHIGLTRAASVKLTLTTIRLVVLGTPAPPPTVGGYEVWNYLNIDEAFVRHCFDKGWLQPQTAATLAYFLTNLPELQKGGLDAVRADFKKDWVNFRRAVSNGIARQ